MNSDFSPILRTLSDIVINLLDSLINELINTVFSPKGRINLFDPLGTEGQLNADIKNVAQDIQ